MAMRTRPREVPVAKPSAVETFVPKVLLRDAKDHKPRGQGWLPNERRPGASKHSASTHQKDVKMAKVDTNEYCSEAEVVKIQSLEEEVTELEGQEFYVAAATFTTQAAAQKTLLPRVRSAKKQAKDTAHSTQLSTASDEA